MMFGLGIEALIDLLVLRCIMKKRLVFNRLALLREMILSQLLFQILFPSFQSLKEEIFMTVPIAMMILTGA